MALHEETFDVDGLKFVWDRAKAAANQRKHGITFEEAATVFADPLAMVREDRARAGDRRMQIMGYSLLGRLILVVHVEVYDEETIRIVSARRLDPRERRRLERE